MVYHDYDLCVYLSTLYITYVYCAIRVCWQHAWMKTMIIQKKNNVLLHILNCRKTIPVSQQEKPVFSYLLSTRWQQCAVWSLAWYNSLLSRRSSAAYTYQINGPVVLNLCVSDPRYLPNFSCDLFENLWKPVQWGATHPRSTP